MYVFLRYKMRCMLCFVAPFLRWSLYGGIFFSHLRLCCPIVMACTLLYMNQSNVSAVASFISWLISLCEAA